MVGKRRQEAVRRLKRENQDAGAGRRRGESEPRQLPWRWDGGRSSGKWLLNVSVYFFLIAGAKLISPSLIHLGMGR